MKLELLDLIQLSALEAGMTSYLFQTGGSDMVDEYQSHSVLKFHQDLLDQQEVMLDDFDRFQDCNTWSDGLRLALAVVSTILDVGDVLTVEQAWELALLIQEDV